MDWLIELENTAKIQDQKSVDAYEKYVLDAFAAKGYDYVDAVHSGEWWFKRTRLKLLVLTILITMLFFPSVLCVVAIYKYGAVAFIGGVCLTPIITVYISTLFSPFSVKEKAYHIHRILYTIRRG